MNYQKIYDDICKRGQERILPKEVYTEKHHIIPKCLGGDNSKENLTVLTAREHFLVHYILAEKLYPKNNKMWYAFWKMYSSNQYQYRCVPSSLVYEYAKIKLSEAFSGENHPLFGKRGSESPNFGRKNSLETRILMRESAMGKNSGEKHGLYGIGHGDLARRKISQSKKGKKRAPETIEKMKNSIALRQDNGKKKSIIINDIIYDGFKSAADAFNLSKSAIAYRIKSKFDVWKNWNYA